METAQLAGLQECLRRHVQVLCGLIGERNHACFAKLERAAEYIDTEFRTAGCSPDRREYTVAGRSYAPLEVEFRGAIEPSRIVIIGAHYDTTHGSRGANDNGSGLAVSAHEHIVSLETIGYCSNQPGSQRLSLFELLLPQRGNLLALIGNRRSASPLS